MNFSIESLIGRAESQALSPSLDSKERSDLSPPTPQREGDESPRIVRKHRPKNFPCPACPMAFSNNGQLKSHIRIHTGERPFTCNQPDCNKSFTRNEELTRHKMIHTGVRPHICPLCAKRFGRKDHLKKHVRTHQSKKDEYRAFAGRHHFHPDKPGDLDEQKTLGDSTVEPKRVEQPSPTIGAGVESMTHASLSFPPIIPMPNVSNIVSAQSPLLLGSMPPMSPSFQAQSLSLIGNAQATIQHLASDYWKNWYSLMGLYQQHEPASR